MKTTLNLSLIALGLFASAASANLSVNVGAITVAPDDSSSSLNVVEKVAGLPANSTQVAVDDNTQLGLTIDYKFNQNWTAELIAATPFSHDISVKGSAIDGLDLGNTKQLPPTLLAQYHFNTGNNFDPFVGLGVNYTKFFNEKPSAALVSTLQALKVTKASDDVDLKLKASWGLALQAGFNYKLSDNWGLHAVVTHMDIDTTGEVRVNDAVIQSVNVQIDPLVYMVGVRWSM